MNVNLEVTNLTVNVLAADFLVVQLRTPEATKMVGEEMGDAICSLVADLLLFSCADDILHAHTTCRAREKILRTENMIDANALNSEIDFDSCTWHTVYMLPCSSLADMVFMVLSSDDSESSLSEDVSIRKIIVLCKESDITNITSSIPFIVLAIRYNMHVK